MRGHRLLALALAFAGGIALPPLGAPALGLGAASPAMLLVASPPLAPVAFFAAGWALASATRARPVPEPGPGPVALEGRITSVPERLEEDRVRFTLRDAGGRRLLMTAPGLSWPLALGDRVRVQARLRTPSGPRNRFGQHFENRDPFVPPFKAVLSVPTRTKNVTIPFELKDLPLP